MQSLDFFTVKKQAGLEFAVTILAHLDEAQEELLHYPKHIGAGISVDIYVKVF